MEVHKNIPCSKCQRSFSVLHLVRGPRYVQIMHDSLGLCQCAAQKLQTGLLRLAVLVHLEAHCPVAKNRGRQLPRPDVVRRICKYNRPQTDVPAVHRQGMQPLWQLQGHVDLVVALWPPSQTPGRELHSAYAFKACDPIAKDAERMFMPLVLTHHH